MMRLLAACIRQRGNISLAVALQNVAVALGFVLVAFLACYSGLGKLNTLFLLLYELFWTLAIVLLPSSAAPKRRLLFPGNLCRRKNPGTVI